MCRIIIKFILLTGFMYVHESIPAVGQRDDSILLNSPLYREKFQLFTDRSLYASGEPVMFRVFNMNNELQPENNLSRVIYIELTNNHNTPVAQAKYMLNNRGSSGQIIIPDTLTTGSYYIRAYTRWMRNFPPSGYLCVPLAIVNPYKIIVSDLKMPIPETVVPESNAGFVEGIKYTSDKLSYRKREKVTVQLKEINTGISPEGYCITIIKNGYLDTDYSYTADQGGNVKIITDGIKYYPESTGLSISGYVIRRQGQQALANSRIYMTLLGSDPDCFEFITDGRGKMHFSIPDHSGSHDVLFTVDAKEQDDIQIIMEDEFSKEYSGFPVSTVDFFLERQDLVEEIMVNSQIENSFMSDKNDTLSINKSKADFPFYGNPDLKYRTDDYIMLPNLEEFFFELIPSVRLIKEKNKRSMVVLGKYVDMSFYLPLILLDYVPVLDIESILPVSPRRIDYIDIINTVYIRGNNYYGGIINLVSKEGDRAGVQLPANSTIINYNTFYNSKEVFYPDYEKQINRDRIPDLRATLCWFPHINLAPDSVKRIEFYTSDIGGKYSVIIRGITKDGKIVRAIGEFLVE